MSQVFSSQPYKGTRDFYPQASFNNSGEVEFSSMDKRNYIMRVWQETLENLGFLPYDASVIENAELYIAKSGEELGNTQLYNFYDKGERHIALRPEMTPSLARVVANKYEQLRFPLRWFSIPNCLRYERPQKGRLREFWQLNVDIIGLSAGVIDVEMVWVLAQIMLAFGATSEQFSIKFNHRELLDKWLQKNNLGEVKGEIYDLLDDWHKTEWKEKIQNLKKITGKTQDHPDLQKLLSLVSPEEIGNREGLEEYYELAQEFEELQMLLGQGDVAQMAEVFRDVDLRLEPTIVRGLAYYTGLVFECFDKNPSNPRALFGGGRYDDLMDLFGKPQTPAIGVGVGDVTIQSFLDNWNLWPQFQENRQKVAILPLLSDSQEGEDSSVKQAEKAQLLHKIYTQIIPKLRQEGKTWEINYEFERSENKRYKALKKAGFEEIVKVEAG
jgi:histidyl-tRNA synthetase